MAQTRIQKRLRSDHIRNNEVLRAMDRSVHVRLRREVNHHVVTGQHLIEQIAVADIALHEGVTRVGGHRRQVLQVSGVGEFVVDGHAGAVVAEGVVGAGEEFTDEVRTDKSGRSGNEVAH